MAGRHQDTGKPHKQMLVTTFVDQSKTVLLLWRTGIEAALPPLVGEQPGGEVIKIVDGWPLPIEPVPALARGDLKCG
ncbi:hypothetical protein [Streptomyces sp. Ac-502]|uniref:hypothetical protein n=1 Tax=Streptomyces sp. Ac-502 TaxID=3342801 RepID=UPI0038627B31